MPDPRLQHVRKLIADGRYDVARSVLRKIDDPVAKSWLKKLNKAHPPQNKKQTSINWMIPALVISLSLGVIIMIVVFQYLPRAIERSIEPEYPDEFGISAEEEQYAQLIHYCTQSTGYGGSDLCLDWADLLLMEYREQATHCLTTTYDETAIGFDGFATCLRTEKIPGFYG